MKVSAIIPAAGQGLRMGGDIPKQFLLLQGKPILHHTLAVFESCVDAVTLVVPEKELAVTRRQWTSGIVQQVIAGGAERQDSVAMGLRALDKDTDIVIVHDGVRPFVSAAIIKESISAARQFGAAVTAIPIRDTVKKSTADGWVQGSVDRENLWRMQTPQAFQYDLLCEAFEKATRDNYYGTDEGSLMEYLGRPVKIIAGSEWNIKITCRDDLALGEKIAVLLEPDPTTQ